VRSWGTPRRAFHAASRSVAPDTKPSATLSATSSAVRLRLSGIRCSKRRQHPQANNPLLTTTPPSIALTPTVTTLALTAQANQWAAKGWPAATSPTPGQDGFRFTVTPNAGDQFTLSTMSLIVKTANAGPTQLTVRTSLDNFATDVATPFTMPSGGQASTLETVDFSAYLTALGQTAPITQPVSIDIYAYASGNGLLSLDSTSGLGTNAITLTGTVTPILEPATVLLIVAAAVGLMRLGWRLRRVVSASSLYPAGGGGV
jgi:hypothetical protein